MSINNIINASKGKWSNEISDLDYAFLKNAADYSEEEILTDETIENSLHELPVQPEGGKTKRKWLKEIICKVLQDPETLKKLNEVPVDDTKKKLVELVVDAVILAIPGIGVIGKLVVKIIVYLLKRALKKGIDNWCQV